MIFRKTVVWYLQHSFWHDDRYWNQIEIFNEKLWLVENLKSRVNSKRYVIRLIEISYFLKMGNVVARTPPSGQNYPFLQTISFLKNDENQAKIFTFSKMSYFRSCTYAPYVQSSAYVFSGPFSGEISSLTLSTYFIGNAFHVG